MVKMSRVFKLMYSGPKGEWLAEGESELDFGHKDGNFLVLA
jgi:hypothetical protein